jgi:hypothetical protein
MEKYRRIVLKESKSIMKRTKKIISLLLVVCLMSLIPINGYASDLSSSNQVFTDDVLGDFTVERIIENGKVTVYAKSLDGTILHTAINDNGNLFLDGEIISTQIVSSPYINEKLSFSYIPLSINWGQWQYSELEFDSDGMTTAAIFAILSALSPWVSLSALIDVASAIVGNYDNVQIGIWIRYGSDDTYFYYERDTIFYGDGSYIYGPVRDSGREFL